MVAVDQVVMVMVVLVGGQEMVVLVRELMLILVLEQMLH